MVYSDAVSPRKPGQVAKIVQSKSMNQTFSRNAWYRGRHSLGQLLSGVLNGASLGDLYSGSKERSILIFFAYFSTQLFFFLVKSIRFPELYIIYKKNQSAFVEL